MDIMKYETPASNRLSMNSNWIINVIFFNSSSFHLNFDLSIYTLIHIFVYMRFVPINIGIDKEKIENIGRCAPIPWFPTRFMRKLKINFSLSKEKKYYIKEEKKTSLKSSLNRNNTSICISSSSAWSLLTARKQYSVMTFPKP